MPRCRYRHPDGSLCEASAGLTTDRSRPSERVVTGRDRGGYERYTYLYPCIPASHGYCYYHEKKTKEKEAQDELRTRRDSEEFA